MTTTRYHLTRGAFADSIGAAPDAPIGHYTSDGIEIYVADLPSDTEPSAQGILTAWREQGAIETGRDIWALEPERLAQDW